MTITQLSQVEMINKRRFGVVSTVVIRALEYYQPSTSIMVVVGDRKTA